MKIKKQLISICMLLAIILTCTAPSLIYANDSEGNFIFDVNVVENGEWKFGGSEYCTYDVYIDDKLVADDVQDFNYSYSYGIKYEIKDIKVASGHTYNGVFYNNPLCGVIYNKSANIHLVIDCKPTDTTFYRNFDETDTVTASQSFKWCTSEQAFTDKKWKKAGYTLLGWSTDNKATEADYLILYDVDDLFCDGHYESVDLYAVWQPNTYDVAINPNGGAIEKDLYMTQNPDGSISLQVTYDSNDFYALGIQTSRIGYTFDGIYDADTDGNQVWNSNGAFVEGKYWDKNGNWIYDGNVTLYCHWKTIDYTMTFDYNKNGELTNADIDSKTVTYDCPYGELPDPGCAGWAFKEWNTKADGSGSTITKDDICKGNISVYALWSYKPVKISLPQTLIGDKNGNSQFIVKSNDIKAGNVKITLPKGFYYNQTGKNPVYASISTDGKSILTKDNKAVKYKITANGLTAGCWNGSFNIGLTLTKE